MSAARATTRQPPAVKTARVRAKKPAVPYAEALGELASARDNVTLDIDGTRITLTRLGKILWPPDARSGQRSYTRRDYLAYLLRLGPYMLPHMRDRPMTLIRAPEGITGRRFVHFHYEQRLPDFVERVMIFSEKNQRAEEFLLCNNIATVLWLAHIGALELHVWHSRASARDDGSDAGTDYGSSAKALQRSALNFPDYIVFDLDPYIYSGSEAPGAQPEFNAEAFERCRTVAFHIKALLESMKLRSYVKTSGKTGLHVLIPIVRDVNYDVARAFAETIAQHLVRQYPNDITTDWNVKGRTGKVFLDYAMNVRVKTLSAPYSARGVAAAPVSMPVTWKDLHKAGPLDYTIATVPGIIEKTGDTWHDILEAKQDLRKALG